MNRLFKLFVSLCSQVLSQAQVWRKLHEFRWTHFGPRPLAMGNAYTAVADDHNALFYNPAGLLA